MRNFLISIALFLLLPSTALAQQPLAGSSVRLPSQSSAPSNLTGAAGIYNKAGAFTWHTAANADLFVLQCSTCTTGFPALSSGKFLTNDGTNLSWATVSAGTTVVGWSFVDACGACGVNGVNCPNGQGSNKMFAPSIAAGNFSTGDLYAFTADSTVTAIRTYWAGTTNGQVLKMCMWDAQTQTRMQCANVTVTATPGIYQSAAFAVPQAATAYHMYSFSVWETSGSNYTVCEPVAGLMVAGTSALMNWAGKTNTFVWDVSDFSAGDTFIGQRSSNEHHATEPVFTTP